MVMPFQLAAIGSGVASTPKSLARVLRERRAFQNVAGLGIETRNTRWPGRLIDLMKDSRP